MRIAIPGAVVPAHHPLQAVCEGLGCEANDLAYLCSIHAYTLLNTSQRYGKAPLVRGFKFGCAMLLFLFLCADLFMADQTERTEADTKWNLSASRC